MDDLHDNAREQFFAAMRSLAASADSIQTRLIEANAHILLVTIDEFAGDRELKIKFAKLLDLFSGRSGRHGNDRFGDSGAYDGFRSHEDRRPDLRFLLRPWMNVASGDSGVRHMELRSLRTMFVCLGERIGLAAGCRGGDAKDFASSWVTCLLLHRFRCGWAGHCVMRFAAVECGAGKPIAWRSPDRFLRSAWCAA